jgi:glycine dehydrogenase
VPATIKDLVYPLDTFMSRHIGPRSVDISEMLHVLGLESLESLVDQALPSSIRMEGELAISDGQGESDLLAYARSLGEMNVQARSYIGMGYYDCVTPPVIQRNVFENPAWYTQYTPYQAEISQGRLEALLNFQTMVSDLTGLAVANASLLDEATAAAEGMALAYAANRKKRQHFFVGNNVHPQTLDVVRTRSNALGITLWVDDAHLFDFEAHGDDLCGALLQYPDTRGGLQDLSDVVDQIHQVKALAIVACDLLSLALLKSPGEMGADVAVGSAQRFGVPMGYGGPHAGFFATTQRFKRQIPGRIVGVSKDAEGKPALRLALQTREQHIRREKATSNICTAQVLLAVMASMFAVYHGPAGIKAIATRVHELTCLLKEVLSFWGYLIGDTFFDTLHIQSDQAEAIVSHAQANGVYLRLVDVGHIGVSLDETSRFEDLKELLLVFKKNAPSYEDVDWDGCAAKMVSGIPVALKRKSAYLSHSVFDRYHSETEMLRYLERLSAKDLALNTSMIPLGSCTMKLNATAEMMPLSWLGFASLHPFSPRGNCQGYTLLIEQLGDMIKAITGFTGVSLQPNAGSQGEYAGLLAIDAYHRSRDDEKRKVCLIPSSAHGTNPASAVMAGMQVVVVACDAHGNIDVRDLSDKIEGHREQLSALMVTYPSTHGVFETSICDIASMVHNAGGQVYMDGANLTAMVGLSRPADIGADVCHLNLHKTFAIPHGGGGPGMGPIAVAEHLKPFLPGHKVVDMGQKTEVGAIAAAPFGSASILAISWAYMRLMGGDGLTRATQIAIVNANYMAKRLEGAYDVLYRGAGGWVAHEFIIDLRPFKQSAGVTVDDVAKRLMDYGFHAPTMSWPVAGTMMIEPTESESKEELDRFCDAMLKIREEIKDIETQAIDPHDNPLKNAPHTQTMLCGDTWTHPYPRSQAAFPMPHLKDHKFWPASARIDNTFGDRNLQCSCLPIESYQSETE